LFTSDVLYCEETWSDLGTGVELELAPDLKRTYEFVFGSQYSTPEVNNAAYKKAVQFRITVTASCIKYAVTVILK